MKSTARCANMMMVAIGCPFGSIGMELASTTLRLMNPIPTHDMGGGRLHIMNRHKGNHQWEHSQSASHHLRGALSGRHVINTSRLFPIHKTGTTKPRKEKENSPFYSSHPKLTIKNSFWVRITTHCTCTTNMPMSISGVTNL